MCNFSEIVVCIHVPNLLCFEIHDEITINLVRLILAGELCDAKEYFCIHFRVCDSSLQVSFNICFVLAREITLSNILDSFEIAYYGRLSYIFTKK